MQSTVLVPNSQASSTWGASVASTSHSGITTLSSTWLVHRMPVKKVARIQPVLRTGPGPVGFTRASPLATLRSWGAAGSRVIQNALRHQQPAANSGVQRMTVRLPVASAMPPISGAEGEADVERGVHVGLGLDPLLGAARRGRRRGGPTAGGAEGREARRAATYSQNEPTNGSTHEAADPDSVETAHTRLGPSGRRRVLPGRRTGTPRCPRS